MKHVMLLIITFSPLIASAQHKKLTSFGFKGGANRSAVNGHELNGTDTGYNGLELYAAFFADTELNTRWRIGNEILYSFTDEYHFIETPLHIKFSTIKRGFVLLGPKLDMIVNNDDEIYNFKNFGLSADLGFQYDITPRIISEIRYSKGLTKQINDFALDIYDGRRNTIRIGLGFRF